MAFDEVQFPLESQVGTAGGPQWSTAITTLDSGGEERVQRWASARRRYRVDLSLIERDEVVRDILSFLLARDGAARGCRFEDPSDHSSAPDGFSEPDPEDVVIGVGDDVATQFQLVKPYVSGTQTRVRTISKPQPGTVRIAIDGVEQTSGWTVDETTGVVTFTTPPDDDEEVTAGFYYDVPVRLSERDDQGLQIAHTGPLTARSSVELVEILDASEAAHEPFAGGAKAHGTLSSALQLSAGAGLMQSYEPDGLQDVFLPRMAPLPLGGPWFVLANDSGSNSVELRDHADDGGDVIHTHIAAQLIEVYLDDDGSGGKEWRVVTV